MKTNLKIAIAFSLAVAATAVTTAPAYADDQGAAVIGSQAFYLEHATKQLSAGDTQSDGRSAIAKLQNQSGTLYKLTNSNGSGTTSFRAVSVNPGATCKIRAGVVNLSSGGSPSYGPWVTFRC